MHEDVLRAHLWRDETEAFLLVPPLHHAADAACRGRLTFRRIGGCLRFQDLGDLAPLQALSDTDANDVALVDAEASAGKDRTVQKDIGTVVNRHEAEALLGAEPLDAAEHDRFRYRYWPTLLGG
jgi:hypothetical protein